MSRPEHFLQSVPVLDGMMAEQLYAQIQAGAETFVAVDPKPIRSEATPGRPFGLRAGGLIEASGLQVIYLDSVNQYSAVETNRLVTRGSIIGTEAKNGEINQLSDAQIMYLYRSFFAHEQQSGRYGGHEPRPLGAYNARLERLLATHAVDYMDHLFKQVLARSRPIDSATGELDFTDMDFISRNFKFESGEGNLGDFVSFHVWLQDRLDVPVNGERPAGDPLGEYYANIGVHYDENEEACTYIFQPCWYRSFEMDRTDYENAEQGGWFQVFPEVTAMLHEAETAQQRISRLNGINTFLSQAQLYAQF